MRGSPRDVARALREGRDADLREIMTERWYPLRRHPEQDRLVAEDRRYKMVIAGRRSGKTERMKREGVLFGVNFDAAANGRAVFAAPTQQQAVDIYWDDLKAMTPAWALAEEPRETAPQTLRLYNGFKIEVRGMDKPQRIEGSPLDWICVDEYAACKKTIWGQNIRPALSTMGRPGIARLIGKPVGRNHAWEMWNRIRTDKAWGRYHWKSADLLDPEEIAAARAELDPLSFAQEYEASFVNFEGRAYYCYDREVHSAERVAYDPRRPLMLCFDFNRSPGVCCVAQELTYEGRNPRVADEYTGVVGEVWIPVASNTPRVCRKIIEDWGKHKGEVILYGDATGGARTTKSEYGSDWEVIWEVLRPAFRERLVNRVPRGNGSERVRVNSVNSRLMTADGTIRMLVDPDRAPRTCDCLEGTVVVPGSAGDILKEPDSVMSHMSDGLGYMVVQRHPIGGGWNVAEETM